MQKELDAYNKQIKAEKSAKEAADKIEKPISIEPEKSEKPAQKVQGDTVSLHQFKQTLGNTEMADIKDFNPPAIVLSIPTKPSPFQTETNSLV